MPAVSIYAALCMVRFSELLSNRFLALINPIFTLGSESTQRILPRLNTALVALFAVFAILTISDRSYPLLEAKEYDGFDIQIDEIATVLDNDVILLANTKEMQDLAVSLKFIKDIRCYIVYEIRDFETLLTVIEHWIQSGIGVQIGNFAPLVIDTLRQRFDVTPSHHFALSYKKMSYEFVQLPDKLDTHFINLDLYRVQLNE